MALSPAGAEFIKNRESLKLEPYNDAKGQIAIGYGHTITPDTEKLLGYNPLQAGTISVEDAEKLFQSDISKFNNRITSSVKVPLTQAQEDALTSLAYNIGEGAFQNSTLLQRLNSGDIQGAAESFQDWKYSKGKPSKGLLKRRQLEAANFLGTDTSALPNATVQPSETVYTPSGVALVPREDKGLDLLTPDPYKTEPQAGFWDKVLANTRESPILNEISLYWATKGADPTPQPGYNPYKDSDLKGYEDASSLFLDSPNPAYTEALKRWVDSQREKQSIQADGGLTNFISGIAFGLVSPMTVIPGVGLYSKAISELGLGTRILAGTALGGGAAAANEQLLRDSDPTRKFEEESLPNIGVSAALGGLLFGLAPKIKNFSPEEKSSFKESLEKQKADLLSEVTEENKSVGAMGVRELDREMWQPVPSNFVSRTFNWLTQKFTPARRLETQDTSTFAAKARVDLLDTNFELGLNKEGFATPMSVEGAANVNVHRSIPVVQQMEEDFLSYKKQGGNLSRSEFMNELTDQYMLGTSRLGNFTGKSPQVLNDFFNVELKRAVKYGIISEDAAASLANSRYITFVYDKAAINLDPRGFYGLIYRRLQQLNPNTTAIEIEELANSIFDKILKEPIQGIKSLVYTAPEGKERILDLPYQEVKPYLIKDAMYLTERYTRHIETEIAGRQVLGTTDFDTYIKGLDVEYEKNISKPGLTDAERTKLRKDYQANKRDIKQIWDIAFGRAGLPDDPTSLWYRGSNVLRKLTHLSRGGGIALSQLADMGYPIFAKGMFKEVGAAVKEAGEIILGAKWNDLDLKELGLAISAYNSARASMHGVGSEIRGLNPFENLVNYLNEKFNNINLMNPMNDFNQRYVGFKIANQTMIDMQKWKKGLLTNAEIKNYLRYGIGEAERDSALKAFAEHSTTEDGITMANPHLWGNEGLDIKSYIQRKVNETILVPRGADLPSWMYSPVGQLIGQYRRFGFGMLNQVLLPGLQQMDREFLLRATTSTFLGALAYLIKLRIGGQLIKDQDITPERLIMEGIDRGGILGSLGDIHNTFERFSGYGVNKWLANDLPSRYNERTQLSALLGAPFGMIEDLSTGVAQSLGPEGNAAAYNKIIRNLPFYNLLYWKWLTSQFGEQLESMF